MGREEMLAQGHHLHSLGVVAGEPETILVGAHAGLFKSNDGGKTWEAAPGEATKTDVMGLYVHQKSDPVIYASGHDIAIMKSTDGGQNWTSLRNGLPDRADVHAITSNPNNSKEVYVWVVGTGVFKSANSGANWSLISPGLAKANVFSLVVHPQSPDTLYAGTESGLLITRNGGFTWNPVQGNSSGKPLFSLLIDLENPKAMWGGTQQGLLKSVDGGLTWTPTPGIREDILALARHPLEPKKFYALTPKGKIIKSEDGGNTWQ